MVNESQAPPAPERLDLAALWAAGPPTIDFVLPGLALGTVGLVVATGGTGKTFAMLATALGVAVGRDVGNLWGECLGAGEAVFISLEDPKEILQARLSALRPHLRDDEQAMACARLHVLSCAGRGLSFAASFDREPELSPWFGAVAQQLQAHKARLCVVDTFNRALGGVSENDSGAMGWMIAQIETVAREAQCAIVLCHHVSKQAVTLASAGEAHAARGSSVITDNARWQCNLTVPNDADKRFKGMPETARRRFVQLSFSKLNYGLPLAPRWLHRADDGVLTHRPEIAGPMPTPAHSSDGATATPSKSPRRPAPVKSTNMAARSASPRPLSGFDGMKGMRSA